MHSNDEDEKPVISEAFGKTGVTPRPRRPQKIEDQALEILASQGAITELRASDAMLEGFYEKGYILYNAGKYKDALEYFQKLNTVNPKEVKYIFATGATYHMMKNYEMAMRYYSFASAFEENNPIPPYHLADCLLRRQQKLPAMIFLEMAIDRSRGKPNFKSLHHKSTLMYERLGKELGERKAKLNQELGLGNTP